MTAIASRVDERLDEETRAARLESVEETAAALESTIRAMGESDAPDDPRPSKAEVVDALESVVPNAYVVDEGVTAKYALLTRWTFTGEDLLSNKSGGLGYGLPASVGAALAEATTDDPSAVVAHVGDGSYLYYPQAVGAAVRLGLDLTIVVQDNRKYHILENNAEAIFGDGADEEVPGLDIGPGIDLVGNAESYGAAGYRVETPAALAETLREAVEDDGVSLVDVTVHD
jgi:benzoylformate decarboxylase